MHDYDTRWLGDALRRAATAAEREDFPFLDEILHGIEEYLDSRCPLQLLPISTLFDRVRRMLEMIGCHLIAEKLEPLAPPVTVCLASVARRTDAGFELGFFSELAAELRLLREAGAEEVRFVGLLDSVRHLRGTGDWDAACDALRDDIRAFLHRHHREETGRPRAIRLHLEGERVE